MIGQGETIFESQELSWSTAMPYTRLKQRQSVLLNFRLLARQHNDKEGPLSDLQPTGI